LLKHLLNLKLSLARKVVKRLPESMQKLVQELETQIMRALYDISKEYGKKASIGEDTKQVGGLRAIEVE